MRIKLMRILKEINQFIKLKFSVKRIILTLLSGLIFLRLYSLFSQLRGIFLYVFSIFIGILNIIILVSVTIIYFFKRKLKIFKIPLVIFMICICSLISGFIASSIYINEVNRKGAEIIEALNNYYSITQLSQPKSWTEH